MPSERLPDLGELQAAAAYAGNWFQMQMLDHPGIQDDEKLMVQRMAFEAGFKAGATWMMKEVGKDAK